MKGKQIMWTVGIYVALTLVTSYGPGRIAGDVLHNKQTG